ncbi:MAG: DUF3109 family protein [Chitinophagales bacterium]|nr:DUF3109 family protein [Chitinophagales bacterium]MDW8392896.1 DUF3109 family protein [Chitinophagales bacterium]
MIVIDKTIISDDVVEKPFACEVSQCKGACCVEGDSGAPLLWEEALTLETLQEYILPHLTEDGRQAIRQFGAWQWDSEGDLVTPLINGVGACAYAITENGITRCGIEQAWSQGLWKHTAHAGFSKPVSCHLYPVRITRYDTYDAVNYHRWNICAPACTAGRNQGIRLFEFVRQALIRRYGEQWYEQLNGAAAQLASQPVE